MLDAGISKDESQLAASLGPSAYAVALDNGSSWTLPDSTFSQVAHKDTGLEPTTWSCQPHLPRSKSKGFLATPMSQK